MQLRALAHPLLVSCLLVACDDKITEPRLALPTIEAGADGDAAAPPHVVPPAECVGACCPTDPACYGTPAGYSGAECLAQFDNTSETRWQLRQTWSQSELPAGNAAIAVSTVLGLRSELPWPECNQDNEGVLGGMFMQLVDFDLATNIGRVGFAKAIPTDATGLSSALTNGLCMIEGPYQDATVPALPVNLTKGATWPAGLPDPMLLPWTAAPARAVGLTQDFDFAAERTTILAKFAPGGEYAAAGYTGIFYLDRAKGYLHGYAPLAFVAIYDSGGVNILPIREGEITAQINDPEHPNCVGIYRGDALDPTAGCTSSPTNPEWGCPGNECAVGKAPNVTKGYFLITELEQVFNSTLNQTICASDSVAVDAYGSDPAPTQRCRDWTKWDPANPATGLPMGDWCAETNSVATPECHNAFRSISYAAFQGFKIQANTCPI